MCGQRATVADAGPSGSARDSGSEAQLRPPSLSCRPSRRDEFWRPGVRADAASGSGCCPARSGPQPPRELGGALPQSSAGRGHITARRSPAPDLVTEGQGSCQADQPRALWPACPPTQAQQGRTGRFPAGEDDAAVFVSKGLSWKPGGTATVCLGLVARRCLMHHQDIPLVAPAPDAPEMNGRGEWVPLSLERGPLLPPTVRPPLGLTHTQAVRLLQNAI